MKKKKETRHMKRKEGKKLYNFGFEIEDVDRWKTKAEEENRSLTNLVETVMNKYCKAKKSGKSHDPTSPT